MLWLATAAARDDIAFIGVAPSFLAASPGDGATGLTPSAVLTWSFTDSDSYDLYFGTSSTPPLFATGLTVTTAMPAQAANTQYYWQVIATNTSGSTPTAVFSFTTGAAAASSKSSGPCRVGAGASGGIGFASAALLMSLGLVGGWIARRRDILRSAVTAP